MKKGCLIVFLVLLVLVVGGIAGGALYLRAQLGLTLAPAVSHDAVLNEHTRFLVAVEPRQLTPLVEKHVLPRIDALEVPPFIKDRLRAYAVEAIPNEVALAGGPNTAVGQLNLSLFINERFFGPIIARFTQNPADYSEYVQTAYEGPVFLQPERGALVADLSVPLLKGMDTLARHYWPDGAEAAPMTLEGGHLVEAVVDNREGQLLALAGALARREGLQVADLFRNPQQERAVAHLLRLVSDVRATLDLLENGAAAAHVALGAFEDSPSPFSMRVDVGVGPAVMQALDGQIGQGALDAPQLALAAAENLDRFAFETHFDNQREGFMALMADLGVFDSPEMANLEQQLKVVIKLMTESTLSAFLLENGDLAGEWRVMSAPENRPQVFLALGMLPIDQALLPLFDDFARRFNMGFTAGTPDTGDDAAYKRTFTIRGFRQGLEDIAAGRIDFSRLQQTAAS